MPIWSAKNQSKDGLVTYGDLWKAFCPGIPFNRTKICISGQSRQHYFNEYRSSRSDVRVSRPADSCVGGHSRRAAPSLELHLNMDVSLMVAQFVRCVEGPDAT
jgi:hypothetical protein